MRRGDQAMFSCTVNFQLPKEEITYSWKFAEGGVSRGGARAEVFWRRVRLHGRWGVRTQGWGSRGGEGRRIWAPRFRFRAKGGSWHLGEESRLTLQDPGWGTDFA